MTIAQVLMIVALVLSNAVFGENEDPAWEVKLWATIAGWEHELLDEVASVAWCESRWRPDAVGDHGSSLGLMQLWTGWFNAAGQPIEHWDDPVTNLRTAKYVYDNHGGWAQWTCKP